MRDFFYFHGKKVLVAVIILLLAVGGYVILMRRRPVNSPTGGNNQTPTEQVGASGNAQMAEILQSIEDRQVELRGMMRELYTEDTLSIPKNDVTEEMYAPFEGYLKEVEDRVMEINTSDPLVQRALSDLEVTHIELKKALQELPGRLKLIKELNALFESPVIKDGEIEDEAYVRADASIQSLTEIGELLPPVSDPLGLLVREVYTMAREQVILARKVQTVMVDVIRNDGSLDDLTPATFEALVQDLVKIENPKVREKFLTQIDQSTQKAAEEVLARMYRDDAPMANVDVSTIEKGKQYIELIQDPVIKEEYYKKLEKVIALNERRINEASSRQSQEESTSEETTKESVESLPEEDELSVDSEN